MSDSDDVSIIQNTVYEEKCESEAEADFVSIFLHKIGDQTLIGYYSIDCQKAEKLPTRKFWIFLMGN